jgi:hypothetical protein
MRKITWIVAAGLTGVALTAGTLAVAQSTAKPITACVKKSGGQVRVVTAKTKCRSSERRLTWNAQGPKGASGATGASGTPGATGAGGAPGTPGAAGAAGPSEALSGRRDGSVPLASPMALVGRLALPTAGNYVINAKVSLEQTSTTVATTATCELEVDGVKDEIITKLGNSAVAGVPQRDAVALQLVRTTTGPTSATLSCGVGNMTTGQARLTRITAIRVGAITDGELATS